MNQTIYIFRLLLLFAIAACPVTAQAFDLTHYADNSALSSGHWVKISVTESGLYKIPASTLRRWGFSDPSKVTVHGYGARRIADALTAANYIDDLPAVATSMTADKSIVFYAAGPYTWEGTDVMYRSSSPYSSCSYYYLTDSRPDDAPQIPVTALPVAGDQPSTTFIDRIHHETDLVSPGEGGQMLVGEDFKYTPSRRFKFNLPDICGQMVFRTSFVAKTVNAPSALAFSVNGAALPRLNSDQIGSSSSSAEVYGTEAKTTHSVANPGENVEIIITHSSTVLVQSAWLNFIAVNYERSLRLPSSGSLQFSSNSQSLQLANAPQSLKIWDVTDPSSIYAVDHSADGNSAFWTVTEGGRREYAAWTDAATLPSPTFVENVANQNLHADQPCDMVIFTHPAWAAQAQRIAALHSDAPDNLLVKVVNVNDVYNEFSSGAADVSGLRKYLKMLYDRGLSGDRQLKYVLLMGRQTYDERHLTSGVQSLGVPTIPAWQVRDERLSLEDEKGFVTDDFLAMLDDGSGTKLGLDQLSVAVGRLPIISASHAKVLADKIVDYARRATPGAWKNRVMCLADDLDGGIHYKQSEWFMRGIGRNTSSPYVLEKVYLPAFEKSNGVYQGARDNMFRTLDEGVAWWTFVGHATNHSWTADGMFTFTDINNLYLRHLPFVYAATCNFLRWDSNTQSGGEILMGEPNGGVIGMISATRPAYITYNGYFTNAIGKELSRRDASGRLLPAGEIYRRAKNNIRAVDDNGIETSVVNNDNRLRYAFMGDPALRLATPGNLIEIRTVGDLPTDGPDQIILPARGMPVIKGIVTDPAGERLVGFNGTLLLDIYDADRSVTLTGSEYEKMKPFDEHGDRLYSGSCRVTDGEFTLTVAMPTEITDNFREATISMIAYADDGLTEASGLNHSCYVYGYDETVGDDTEAPVIESLVLNHPSFADGEAVNPSPLLIAHISDNVGINLSMAGIGRQMSVMLDDKRSFNDVPFYFTPSSDGTPSGDIAYPLEGLSDGNHTLRLRVFDTNGNSATRSIDFCVRQDVTPLIFDIYTDANPAYTEANFYLSHNRPESMLTVTVSVFNLLGQKLWSSTSTARSDMFLSSPVTWNLTDSAGRRVPRGIYLYSATITADGENFATASRKIAVAPR